MRTVKFAPNEYYHICNRGVLGNNIFLDERDYTRFLFLLLYFQSPIRLNNISWYITALEKKGSFGIKPDTIKEMQKTRQVDLISFALMPNHFHILLCNLEDQITSVYMHRVLTAYSKYFNAKYKKKGHLFQGPFMAVRIENNEQRLHTSAYIHKNPIDVSGYRTSYEKYKYSSLQDYLGENRWGTLLSRGIILEQFKKEGAYKRFVETSSAKSGSELSLQNVSD